MRPYVICHMLASLDSKVTGEFLFRKEAEDATELYYEINRVYGKHASGAYGFACGRITMEGSFTGGYYPELSQFKNNDLQKTDYIATRANFYAVAFDRKGKLGWKSSRIEDTDPGYDGAHIIEVLTEEADTAYIAYLRNIGVSYIFAGKSDTDIGLALQKLHSLFGIETLLLEGGSVINGAFSRADAVDEISLVVAPVVGSSNDKPLFENARSADFKLTSLTQHKNNIIHIIYKKEG